MRSWDRETLSVNHLWVCFITEQFCSCAHHYIPTTVSLAVAESWSRVVFMMQVYTPASSSVTSVMVRLSESTISLQKQSADRYELCFSFFYNIQYTKDPAYIHNSTQIPDKDLIFIYFLTAGFKKEDISGYKKLWPLIVRQLSIIFEPGHRGNERRVMFYRALKHHRSAPLDFFVFWLLQDSGWLCWGKNKEVQALWNCHVFAPS